MNSTELNPNISKVIITFHHVSGVVFFLINILVCFLIFFDTDPRGRIYRKYLMTLQISSMTLDLSGNIYTPIMLLNCRLLYSDSWIAHYIDINTFGSINLILSQAIVVCIFAEVVVSYFACVYYRRLPMGLERAAMDQQSQYCQGEDFNGITIMFAASATSALVFSLITTHTVAHSLAILACSPTHRQTIQATVMRMI
ncbi:hypothetical protein PENTCL1PPCAC_16388, partial [Pristionchus entomophagus]